MSNLSLRHLYKVYPNGVKAVNDFNMEIEDREFIVFVGPSGCGKSTTLRMIAGLEEITAGELYIGDTFSNHVEPKDRDIAMVFQNYALYPHMTVYENLAFGLRLRHVPQAEIHKKVLWAAKILKLEEYLERKPKALSGGQRQRVSLGRAILRTPKVLLLDEPLSNLDAKLRTEMRAEIAKLHQEIATTFIYVTHDQVEAMTMGTRIVVMSMGYVQQIDTPQNLYNYPENKFVAGFIGTPQMNFFKATLLRKDDKVEVRFEGIEKPLTIPYEQMLKVRPEYLNGDRKVIIGLRCEHLSADESVIEKSDNVLKMKISHFEELGNETLIYGDFNLDVHGLGDSDTAVIVKQYGGTHTSKIGDVIDVAVNMEKAHFFDGKTEQTIAPRIPRENVFDVTIEGDKLKLLGQTITLPVAVMEQLSSVVFENRQNVLIPTDALIEGGKDFTATVVNEEVINKTIVTHLKSGDRTFFMISDRKHAPGEKLDLGIDFKSISVLDGQKEVVTALPASDTFVGSYFDRLNAKRSSRQLVRHFETLKKQEISDIDKKMNQELAHIVMTDALLKEFKAEYLAKRVKIQEDMSYSLGLDGAKKEARRKIKQKADAELVALKKDYDEKVASFKKAKSDFALLPEAEKAERLEKERKIREDYEAQKTSVAARYDEMIKVVNDNLGKVEDTLLPVEKQKQEETNRKITACNDKYKAEREALIQKEDASISEAEQKVAAASGEEKDVAIVALKDAKRSKLDKVNALLASHNAEIDDILFESKVFAAYIDGRTFITDLDINKKIVKGLGAQLFLSHYRFEAAHDAYEIEEGGIELTVKGMLDYGKDKYAVCEVDGNVVYVETTRDYKEGDVISVSIDVTKAKIFENKFDIRLY